MRSKSSENTSESCLQNTKRHGSVSCGGGFDVVAAAAAAAAIALIESALERRSEWT